MFFRFRQVSFTALLLILLSQLILSPLLYSLTLTKESGQTSTQPVKDQGSSTPKNEPFFVSQKAAKPHQYPALARRIASLRDSASEAITPAVVAELKQSIQKELDTAKQSGAPLWRRLEYDNWLQEQIQPIDLNPGLKEKVLNAITSGLVGVGAVFSGEPDSAEPAAKETILIPDKPSTFKFSETDVKIQTLTPPSISQAEKNPRTLASIFRQARQAFVGLWRASPVLAQDQSNLPSLADVKADDAEVIIDSRIESLAAELNYNPVAITNYVRSNVKYEPYFGAQKGSIGCLAQLVCNDIDTASLTIALLRAAGVPARYKHSFIRVPVGQLKTLLGVDQVKTVYVALTVAGLSPKLVNTSIPVGTNIDAVDIENETQLALEWTWAEAYLEYDERGGNISFASTKDAITGFTDDAGLRQYLASFPKKQWLALEPLLNRSITRSRNTIAADSAGVDAKQFWLNYYQYQGTSAPITKFLADINNSASSSFSLTANKNNYDILPPVLPYSLVASADNNAAVTILTAPYSVLPNAWRQTVIVSIKSQNQSQTFLNKTFYASEINNQSVYLRYNGATETDTDVIASYGGLSSTPAPLVQIVPYLEFAGQLQSGTTPIHIGDTLVLETTLTVNGAVKYDCQKFSTAGNEEGIFIAFSTIAPDANLDNLNESGLLAQGTPALARKYLQHLVASRDTLSSTLDYASDFRFMRAVITQNRSLNTFNGFPTTFDFSGLTMDASTMVNDYSRRDNYKNHRDHFRLIFGLDASRYEGQLFTDVAGLDGIATVSGLQYAYAHPETYTVHVITSANQGVISGLNISANVKQQITAGVAAGATAVVPDKNIVKGNFQGILYALVNADGTGQYAIGEQVQNGAWTTDTPQQRDYINENNQTKSGFFIATANAAEPENFYQEDRLVDGVMCRITVANKQAIMNTVVTGWSDSYGFPCNKGTLNFGMVTHSFIQASNASKFTSSGKYDYWVREAQVRVVLENDKNKNNAIGLSNIRLDGKFRFDLLAGSYVQGGRYGSFITGELAAYYEPNATTQDGFKGRGRIVYGDILKKLKSFHYNGSQYLCTPDNYDCNNPNYVGSILGYPVENQKSAAPHLADWGLDTQGEYQTFAGGQIYKKTSGINKTYYVPAQIALYYNAQENCLNNSCGSGGVFGFPAGDPKKKNDGITIKQDFEAGEGIVWNTQTGLVGAEYAGNYYCDEIDTNSEFIIGKAALQGLWEGAGELGKGVIISLGATYALSTVIGAVVTAPAGGSGGAAVTIAGWALIGAGVAYGINQMYTVGIDNVLAGVKSQIQYEIKHSGCVARTAYLTTRYVPEFFVIVSGLKNLSTQTPKNLKGITLANNLFTASKSEVIPRLKNIFTDNLKALLPVFNGGEKEVGIIVDNAQNKFNEETTLLTKKLGRPLTPEELSGVASKVFSNSLKEVVFLTKNKLGISLVENFPELTKILESWTGRAVGDSRWSPQPHHMIPTAFRESVVADAKYKSLIDELDALWGGPGKFNLNSAENGVWLPKGIHGNNTLEYSEGVYNRLNNLVQAGASKDRIVTELNTIRNTILEGKMPLNVNWNSANQDLINAIRNSKSIYK